MPGLLTEVAVNVSVKAVAKVGRLAASVPLRAALAENPQARLAVLLSPSVFEAIDRRLPADQFRRVEVGELDRHGLQDVGWIFVPQA